MIFLNYRPAFSSNILSDLIRERKSFSPQKLSAFILLMIPLPPSPYPPKQKLNKLENGNGNWGKHIIPRVLTAEVEEIWESLTRKLFR
jgi:hypothetical protein